MENGYFRQGLIYKFGQVWRVRPLDDYLRGIVPVRAALEGLRQGQGQFIRNRHTRLKVEFLHLEFFILAVGFGISTPAHVRLLSPVADGLIVGSAIVRRLAECGPKPRDAVLAETGQYVGELLTALGK